MRGRAGCLTPVHAFACRGVHVCAPRARPCVRAASRQAIFCQERRRPVRSTCRRRYRLRPAAAPPRRRAGGPRDPPSEPYTRAHFVGLRPAWPRIARHPRRDMSAAAAWRRRRDGGPRPGCRALRRAPGPTPWVQLPWQQDHGICAYDFSRQGKNDLLLRQNRFVNFVRNEQMSVPIQDSVPFTNAASQSETDLLGLSLQ